MSILVDFEIKAAVANRELIIEPYDLRLLQPILMM